MEKMGILMTALVCLSFLGSVTAAYLSQRCKLVQNETVLMCSGWDTIPNGTSNGTTTLVLFNNNIPELKRYVFQHRGFLNLTTLSLRSNNITIIESNTFAGQAGVTNLDLSENNLTKLTSETFSGLSSLMSLNLGKNEISSLPDDILQSLQYLVSLDLSFNSLNKLPKTLHSDGFITHLDLSENPLVFEKNEPILSSDFLIQLFMRSCSLKTLPLKAFTELPRLEGLDLSKNELFELPDGLLNALANLKTLDISENLIIQLDSSSFSSLKALTMLNCEGNLFHISQDCSSFLPMVSSSTSVTESATNVTVMPADTTHLPNLADQFDDDDDQVKLILYSISGGIIFGILILILVIAYNRYTRTRDDYQGVQQQII